MREHFLKLKSNLELDDTFAASIETRHNAMRTYLENNHPDFKDSKLIGSVARKTRIHPGSGKKFDIDVLVIVGEFHSWTSSGGITPQAALDQMHTVVHESGRYGEMNPMQDAPTISVTYSDDLEVQLVPAYVDMIGRDQHGRELGSVGRGYWIVKNGIWQMADYDHEAEYISQRNKLSSGYLIPTIKMLKAMKRIYFAELDSFPLELMAANIIPLSVLIKQGQGASIHYRDLLQEFFEQAPGQLGFPIGVPTASPQQYCSINLRFNRSRRPLKLLRTISP